MGLTPVPDGQLATIVTSLAMEQRPALRPEPPSLLRLARWQAPDSERYRTLFRRVGAPWLWFSRLVLAERDLRAILDDPRVEVFAAVGRAGVELGFLELDFRGEGACVLAYFGLVPELTGQGNGRWLMHHALTLGWRPGIERMTVNTCTLDHPAALGFYQRAGFVPVRRTIETFADPRLTGLLPPNSAPQIPCLGTATSRV